MPTRRSNTLWNVAAINRAYGYPTPAVSAPQHRARIAAHRRRPWWQRLIPRRTGRR